MHKYNLNNITIFLNVLFLIVLTVFFFISFIKNDEIEIVKKNIDKEIITEDKLKVKNFNNIEIEDVALPEIEKKDLDKTIKKNIKFAHDQKLEVLKPLEISQAKKIVNIKIQPLKYEKLKNVDDLEIVRGLLNKAIEIDDDLIVLWWLTILTILLLAIYLSHTRGRRNTDNVKTLYYLFLFIDYD